MSKYEIDKTREIFQRVVNQIGGINNVRVKIDNISVPCCRYNKDDEINEIFVPNRINYSSDDNNEFIIARGILLHECSHVLFAPGYNESSELLSSLLFKHKKLLLKQHHKVMELLNIFLDLNNEYKLSVIFPYLTNHLKSSINEMLKVKKSMLSHEHPFMQILLRCDQLRDNSLKAEWNPGHNKDIKDFINKTVDSFFKKKIYEVNSEDLIKFTAKVYKDYLDLINKLNKHNLSIDNKIDKLNPLKDSSKIAKLCAEKVNISDTSDAIMPTNNEMPGVERQANAKDFSKLSLEEIKEVMKQENKKGGWSNDILSVPGMTKINARDFFDYEEKENLDLTKAKKDGLKIKNILLKQLKLADSFETNHRNGRLNLSNVRDQIMKYGKLVNLKVFNRNINHKKNGELAVDVLIDCSGSMGKTINNQISKMDYAKQMMLTLGHAFDKIPNIELGMYGFTNDYDIIFKSPRKSFNSKNILLAKPVSGNHDGFNLRTSMKRLLHSGMNNRLILIISDGQPAYSYQNLDGYEDIKKLVKEMKSKVKVIGIGIEGVDETKFREMYPNHYIMKSERLAEDISKIIIKKIKR